MDIIGLYNSRAEAVREFCRLYVLGRKCEEYMPK
jgi:hypothetical protein